MGAPSSLALNADAPERADARARGGRWPHVARALGFAALIAIIVARAPTLLSAPRLWAEEGVVYLAHAVAAPWLAALLAPHQGYYALWPNLAAVLGTRIVPLERLALVTTLFALIAQATPLAILLLGRSSLWGEGWVGIARRGAGALAIVLIPESGEVWLNTINSQFHLALAAFLLLAEDMPPQRPARRWGYRLALAIAALTGPVTTFMAPVYIWRAIRARRGEALVHAGIILAGAAVQGAALLSAPGGSLSLGARLGGIDLPGLAVVLWSRTWVVPLAGLPAARAFAGWVTGPALQAGPAFWAAGLTLWALMLGLLALLAGRSASRWRLAGAYLLYAVLALATALVAPGDPKLGLVWPGGAMRYFYPAAVMLVLLIASRAALPGRRGGGAPRYRGRVLGAAAAALALLAALALGAAAYRPGMAAFVRPEWPAWAPQVALWRNAPGYELRLWPEGWSMRLNPAAATLQPAPTEPTP